MIYIDIHSHYKISKDASYALSNLEKAGLKQFITDGELPKNTCIGIHPWWCEDLTESEVDQFFIQLEKVKDNVIAIGECGLDRVHHSDFEKQKRIFKKHLEFSSGAPLILHNVRASSDFYNFITASNTRKMIIHDYQGSLQETKEWLKRGAYFSYGRKLLTGQNSKALESLSIIPLDRLFLETDDMNANIEEVYMAFSIRQNVDLYKVCEQIEENFKTVFSQSVQELLGD
jgi:TatD DNase family protein